MASSKPKRFRLSFVNAAEDIPRLIRAYGRACDGEFGLVLRPRNARGVLVLVGKDGSGLVWQADGADAPLMPTEARSSKEAVALVREEQKGLPTAGPITLRDRWRGWLTCAEGPRVELERKLATYGVLRIVSSPEGWTWAVERTERWFSEPGSDEGSAPTLLEAIQAGLARAMGLLGEACSLRDSHRRAAHDPAWAARYPVRPAYEGRDPTARLKEKRPRKRRAKKEPASSSDAPSRSAYEVAQLLVGEAEGHVMAGRLEQAREALRDAGEAAAKLSASKASRIYTRMEAVEARLVERGAPGAQETFQVGDRVVLDGVHGLIGQEADAQGRVVFLADGRKRGRRVDAGLLQREEAGPVAADVDEAKDKALLDAFSGAIAAALRS